MSESIQILISADDQASGKITEAAANVEKAEKRVKQVVDSLKTPVQRYTDQLRELESLHKSGSLSSEKFAIAQAALQEKIKSSGNSFKEMGGKAKATTEFVGVLATLTGNSQLASYAGQLSQITEKAGQFSEVSKAGGAGAMAFKLGLVGLVGALAVGLGKTIGDLVFQTDKFNRSMEAAKQTALELAAATAKNQSQRLANRREDIELIRDPEEKRAAQQQLLEELNRDIAAVTANVNTGKQAVEDWASAWKITGERKAAAEMAQAELDKDKERLKALKEQRDALTQETSVRAQRNEELRKSNAIQDKSTGYLETLRQEVEYLKASKDEQIALDAARNATAQDRGEAERLLRERDALLAKADAAKQMEEAEKRAAEARKAEADRIKDLEKAELQRLELQRIEIEQGKEAAKVQALVNQGLSKEAAMRIAAEEARLDALKEGKVLIDKNGKMITAKAEGLDEGGAGLKAVEGRLLTRGPASATGRKTLKDVVDSLEGISASVQSAAVTQAMMASEIQQLRQKMEQNDNVMLEGVS